MLASHVTATDFPFLAVRAQSETAERKEMQLCHPDNLFSRIGANAIFRPRL